VRHVVLVVALDGQPVAHPDVEADARELAEPAGIADAVLEVDGGAVDAKAEFPLRAEAAPHVERAAVLTEGIAGQPGAG
jgi:hypothetical protein